MAEQTAIDYESLEWKDDAAGGTPIEAAALNRMEQGIADACAGVDQLRTKRLPTYLVAQDGDTATQDVYQDAILGPCLIVDLATATTYYDNGEDGEGHERTKLTSGADIDDLRDSLSRMVLNDVSNENVNDADYCCKHTFIGLVNGYSYDPLWGNKQMFIVINRGTTTTGAYQIAFAYNDLEFRARKYEGSEWSQWFAIQLSLSHIIIDSGGTFWVQLLQASNGMALVFRTSGLAGFGLSFDTDRKLFQIFDVDAKGKWQNISSITMNQFSLSQFVRREVSDLDSLKGSCFFYSSEAPIGSPIGGSKRVHGISVQGVSTYCNQLASEIGSNIWYARGMVNGVWGDWVRM